MTATTPPLLTLRLIWAAIISSHVVLPGIFLSLPAPAEPLGPPTTLVLLAVATMTPLAGLGLRRALLTKAQGATAANTAFTAAVLGFALAEAGAAIAAVTYFLSQQWLFWGPPAAVALVAMLIQFPRSA